MKMKFKKDFEKKVPNAIVDTAGINFYISQYIEYLEEELTELKEYNKLLRETMMSKSRDRAKF